MKFDHIGIVAPTLAAGRDHLSFLLPIKSWSEAFADPTIDVYVQFGLHSSGICYEIVAPLSEASPVTRALKARDSILNHIAYLVPDLAMEAARLRRARCLPVSPVSPALAYGGKKVQFFMCRLYFIIELIEAPDHKHVYSQQSG